MNCEAGISRSAGIAAALSKIIDKVDTIFFKNFIPNRHIYRTIMEEWADQNGYPLHKITVPERARYEDRGEGRMFT